MISFHLGGQRPGSVVSRRLSDELTDMLLILGLGAVLFLAWVVYPGVILALAASREAPRPGGSAAAAEAQPITVVVATREEPPIVLKRVHNLFDTDYPAGQVDIVIAVDARSDWRIEDYREALKSVDRVSVVRGDDPGGKAAALNAGARAATAPLLLIADTHQSFTPTTIPALSTHLGSGGFAAVTGKVFEDEGDRIMRWYWRYEWAIRRSQSKLRSLVTTSGAICMMHRSSWAPLPIGLICDDLYMTMRFALAGERVGLCDAANAQDGRTRTATQKFQRKVRTLTGLFQFVRWMPRALWPIGNPMWPHFFFHKIMRLVTPYLVLAMLAAAVALAAGAFGVKVLAIVVATFLLILVVAWWARMPLARKMVRQSAWISLLFTAPVLAAYNAIRGRWGVWQHHQSTKNLN